MLRDRAKVKRLPSVRTTNIVSLSPYMFSGKSGAPIFESPTAPSSSDSYRKILIPKDLDKPKFQQKGLIFVWPQKRTLYHNKKLIWLSWILAHSLYLLHVIDVLPTGQALPFKQPPWQYDKQPLHRPHSRDFIIEPDWDSHHT